MSTESVAIGDIRQHLLKGAARGVAAQLDLGRLLHVGQRHVLER